MLSPKTINFPVTKCDCFMVTFMLSTLIFLLTCRLTTKIYWTTCHLQLLMFFEIHHHYNHYIMLFQLGGTQVKIQGEEEIGDLVQGNTASLLRVIERNKPFCRRGKSRCFFPLPFSLYSKGKMDLVRSIQNDPKTKATKILFEIIDISYSFIVVNTSYHISPYQLQSLNAVLIFIYLVHKHALAITCVS